MPTATEDQLTKVSTEAATELVHTFYPAINNNRESISTYYAPTPTILLNGNLVVDGAAVQDIFANQMPTAHYEVQSFNCQIINTAYPTVTPTGIKPRSEMTIKDMSILVIVSGHVRYGDDRNLPHRGFSETFTLIPNPASDRKRLRDWLIQTQNFRLVV
ncbi:hypothetical protein N7495_006927 [Penicillium taxi]|uniref:uncharacterized protein n=1 Tax=Penicillium taxi TaxID=168475 RepID=UPI0025457BB9|nr:uncharacterized protein N7495_006927 [Penicillium taxi]KAJ5895236.1 hypothetical protein N7495_006927 [Penicillium taxi]